MRKEKLFLVFLVTAAIAGGILSFKVQRYSHIFYYPTQDGAACTIRVMLTSTFEITPGETIMGNYTTNAGSVCNLTTLYPSL